MTAARFVVFEGGDGSGKSTQAVATAATLRARGLTVCETFEPGGTDLGAVLRAALLHGRDPVAPVAEALLMAADRAQHVSEVVSPALARGEWVVSDRFLPSSLVYQGVVRGLGVDTVRELNAVAVGAVVPDAVVVLDVGDDEARARRSATAPDRIEGEGDAFHAAVADAYRELARTEGWLVVDGAGPVGEVTGRVLTVLAPWLPT
jgi:dTMP kinase